MEKFYKGVPPRSLTDTISSGHGYDPDIQHMIIVAFKYTLEQIQIEIYVEGITDKWVEMNEFMLRVVRINGLR